MNIRNILLVGLLTCLANSAQAVLVGDKDWMQVTATTGYSWNNFDAIFDTSTGLCDVTDCLLGGTVDVTGYRWASTSEVAGLFQAYGAGDGSVPADYGTSIDVGPGGFDALLADFTATYTNPIAYQILNGLTRESGLFAANNTYVANGLDVGRYIGNIDNNSDNYLLQAYSFSYTGNTVGGWLYKPATVPEPASLCLLFSGLLGLWSARRWRRQTSHPIQPGMN